MKQKFLREIRELPLEELGKLLHETRFSLYNMRVKSKTGQMEKTADIQKEKKKIARILTEKTIRRFKEKEKTAVVG